MERKIAPDLALQLGNLGLRLSEMGLHAESRCVLQDSVDLYQSLVSRDPELYATQLDHALGCLSKCLSHLGQHPESLPGVKKPERNQE